MSEPIETTLEAMPLLSQAEREAVARFGEAIRQSSMHLAEAFDSLGAAAIRAGEAFANLTATYAASEDAPWPVFQAPLDTGWMPWQGCGCDDPACCDQEG